MEPLPRSSQPEPRTPGSSTLATPQVPSSSTRAPPKSDHDKLVEIITLIRALNLSFPRFLKLMFTVEPKAQGNKVLNTVNSFLNASEKPINVDDILTHIYEHRFSSPKPSRPGGGITRPASDLAEDSASGNNWARYRMQQWAIDVVSSMCSKEAEILISTKDNPLMRT
jgi:hypothetical protein